MTAQELSSLFKTFPLYVRFPKERYEEISIAETDQEKFRELFKEFGEMKN
jgi:hypothetical protein